MATNDPVCYSSRKPLTEETKNLKCNQLKSSKKRNSFILSFAVIILTAFSNTLTCHLQYLWRASGDFWQNQYNVICSWFGYDEYAIIVWGTYLVFILMYWFIGLWYTFIDITGKPSFMLRNRIQDNEQYPVSFRQVFRAMRHVLINQTIFSMPFFTLLHPLMVWRGYDSGITLPNFQRVFMEIIFCILIEEAGFYYSHRLMHYPPVYKYIHKEHHEWTSNIAISAACCHPVEHILSNLLPALLGPLILGSHVTTVWLWYSIVIFSTLNLHSGFYFPLGPLSEFHYFHHLKFENKMATDDSVCRSSQKLITEQNHNLKGKLKSSSIKSCIFILSFAIIIFSASSNSLTWNFQHFWRASGDFWQDQYNAICSLFGYDKYAINVWGTFIMTFLTYWFIGLCYTFIDVTGKPSFALRYKIQDKEQNPVSLSQVLKVTQQVLINQTIVGIPVFVLGYYLRSWRGYDSGITLPTFQKILFELIFFILIEEAGFYYSHRLLHHPFLYKYIHKRHHEWTSPIAITAVYCHPVEHIFSNLLPPLLGPLILGSHTATSWLWFVLAIFSTLNSHSGFQFPFFPSPEAHDFHHLKFNQNFGVLGILDSLHGTGSFRQYQMSLTSYLVS